MKTLPEVLGRLPRAPLKSPRRILWNIVSGEMVDLEPVDAREYLATGEWQAHAPVVDAPADPRAIFVDQLTSLPNKEQLAVWGNKFYPEAALDSKKQTRAEMETVLLSLYDAKHPAQNPSEPGAGTETPAPTTPGSESTGPQDGAEGTPPDPTSPQDGAGTETGPGAEA